MNEQIGLKMKRRVGLGACKIEEPVDIKMEPGSYVVVS
jgi:hypothetical protein